MVIVPLQLLSARLTLDGRPGSMTDHCWLQRNPDSCSVGTSARRKISLWPGQWSVAADLFHLL